MRIRTQFIITMLLFGVILVVITASAIIASHQVEKAGRQEKIAGNIALGASELSYLASDYLIYHEPQQLKRWHSRFASFSAEVAGLEVDEPEQQILVRSMQATQARLKEVFDSTASALRNPSGNRSADSDNVLLQVSWSRMAVQSQGLVSDATSLAHLLRQQMDRLTKTKAVLIYLMVGLFGVFLLSSYMLTYRRILKSIATLQAGTRFIGSGNLDFVIKERKNDEIGELSHAFNRMATDLKAVTASKADLEREVAERKRAEDEIIKLNEELKDKVIQLEAANRELDSFTHAVSHDLRSPLRSVDGFSRIILEDYSARLDEEGKNYFQRVLAATQRMGLLIDGLLSLSRISQAEVVRGKVNMSALAQDIAAQLRKQQPERDVEFVIAEGLLDEGDERQIYSVLQNLMGNAWKFTERRANARIEFGVAEYDESPAYFVRDNGVGFDMAYADKLFGLFQRLHRADEFAGTGIGLATVQRIIHRHGGDVWAKGAIGKGATFYFTLK